jgi:hypothetical protein
MRMAVNDGIRPPIVTLAVKLYVIITLKGAGPIHVPHIDGHLPAAPEELEGTYWYAIEP